MVLNESNGSKVYLNGKFIQLSEAKISVLDRGFMFGDGVYEVIPVYKKQPFLINQHLDRMNRSLAALRIKPPLLRSEWGELISKLITSSATANCLVYLHVTRGVYKRTHAFPPSLVNPTVFAMTSDFNPPSLSQRKKGLSATSSNDIRWLYCNIKSTSLLGNVLAKQQAVDLGVDETVQFRDNYLTEGSSSNIWIVEKGKLMGPPRSNYVLEGIRYNLMKKMAEECSIPFLLHPISYTQVDSADELLISSASREILPIVRYNGKPVGDGKPGPVYKQLRSRYDIQIACL